MINPVDSREAIIGKPTTLVDETVIPKDIEDVIGFISMDENSLNGLLLSMGLAMDLDDIKFCQIYFRDTEKRNPTVTELKILDTYWSDHCRHTTFSTTIDDVEFEDGKISNRIKETYEQYLKDREIPVRL